MGWSSGTFSRVHDWAADAAANIDIEADRHDAEDDNLATGINTCLTKDGQNTPTANLPMGGFKHTAVANASARDHYATAAQLQDGSIIWCGTSAGTANAQTLSPTPAITAYVAGQLFRFIAGASSTSSCTLDISGVGAVDVKTVHNESSTGNDLVSGAVHTVVYDGTAFRLIQHVGQLNMRDSEIRRPVLRDYGEVTSAPEISSGAITFDITDGNHFLVDLDENITSITISNPTNSPKLCAIMLELTQDGTGGRTVAFPSSVKAEDGSTFSYTGTAANSVTVIWMYTVDAGTTWRAKVVGQWT